MSNATHCHFERLAAALAAKGVTSLRFDHAMALQGSSERRRPFVSGNYAEEVRCRPGEGGALLLADTSKACIEASFFK